MCTSLISNRKKTIVGWNLDILDMEYQVRDDDFGVYIEILDKTEGWMPLFGANSRGDFVGMPTCHPFDERSNPQKDEVNIINLDIDLLLQKKTFSEICNIVKEGKISSIPGLTFMGALSDRFGNMLHIIPGQGYKYYERPKYQVLTNFSPFKMDSEYHPWMGWNRYQKAVTLLEEADDDFDVSDCFNVLKEVSQEICPTVVSMVFDVTNMQVFWCEKRDWNKIKTKKFV